MEDAHLASLKYKNFESRIFRSCTLNFVSSLYSQLFIILIIFIPKIPSGILEDEFLEKALLFCFY